MYEDAGSQSSKDERIWNPSIADIVIRDDKRERDEKKGANDDE
jgi:hypothetical protein